MTAICNSKQFFQNWLKDPVLLLKAIYRNHSRSPPEPAIQPNSPWQSYCTALLWRQRQNQSRSLDQIRFIHHEWRRLKIMNYTALQPQTAPGMSQYFCLFASPKQLTYNPVVGVISVFKHELQNLSKLAAATVILPKPKKEKDCPNLNSPSFSENVWLISQTL